MVYRVILSGVTTCRHLQTFGSREMAEAFIARYRPASARQKLSVQAVEIPADSPALQYPYLPGVGR
jgi:hypothetical protein